MRSGLFPFRFNLKIVAVHESRQSPWTGDNTNTESNQIYFDASSGNRTHNRRAKTFRALNCTITVTSFVHTSNGNTLNAAVTTPHKIKTSLLPSDFFWLLSLSFWTHGSFLVTTVRRSW
jgi:hypothetical protein